MANKKDNGIDLSSFSSGSRRRRKRNGRLIAVNIITSIVLVISTIALTGMMFLNSNPFVDRSVGSEPDVGEVSEIFEDVSRSEGEDITYFLVIGMDESESLTDIMMVVCYDHGNNKANILQIPRDLYIGSDVNTGKVNAVYGSAKKSESRINTLIKRINTHLGLPIDHYVMVTLKGFRNIVDSVGGIDLYIPKKLRVADSADHEIYYLGPGETHLNGKKAEAFVRCRDYAKGDISRVEAQRNFYAAFAKKMMNMSLTQMLGIATSCYDKVKTDMAVGTLLGYAQEVRNLSLEDITIYAVPGQSGTYKPSGLSVSRSYYSIHKEDYVAMINEHFMPYSDPISSSDLKITELHTTKEASSVNGAQNFGELAN